MARCYICDKQSEGLSDYNPMESFFTFSFHEMPDGGYVCDECYSLGQEALVAFEEDEEEEVLS